MDVNLALEKFSAIVEDRISLSGASFQANFLSEDTVCFFLATGFLLAGVPAHRIEMEVPHPALKKPQGMQMAVDIRVADATRTVWIEVKFDRKSRYGSQLNETNRFGELLEDFLRAGLLPDGNGIVFI